MKNNLLDVIIPPEECFPSKGVYERVRDASSDTAYKPLTLEEFKKAMYDLFWKKHENKNRIQTGE